MRPVVLGFLVICAGCTPAQSVSTPSDRPTPAPPAPVLLQRSVGPRAESFAAMGLTGVNKPNGLMHRLRESVPAHTPAWIPRTSGELVLWIADQTPEGWLALHRTPLGMLPGAANAQYRAALYSESGELRWSLDLNRFLSRPTHLEIQDIRLHQGRLFFNEACQSYAREAGGNCSSLVRLDPERQRVEWRTGPRVSNNIFLVEGQHLVAGYGFTSEPDSLFLVHRQTGAIQARAGLDSAHTYLEMMGGELVVVTNARVYRFALRGE